MRGVDRSGSHKWWALLALLIPSSVPAFVHGQPVPSREPLSTHVFPAGGRRGTTVAVRIGGECLPPGAKLRLWGAGVLASGALGPRSDRYEEPSPRRKPTEIPIYYPKEWDATFEIAQGATLGPRWWRLTSARGGTGARPFIVGDLPEFIETESNSAPDRAERIAMPVTVNGRIAGERDLDYFVFAATEGDVVVCDVVAGRLGSALAAAVEIRDAQGRRVEVEEIQVGSDPVVAFKADQSGDFSLLISHIGVHGGPHYVYRMTVSTTPYAPFVFPPGGQVGQTREVQLATLSGTGAPQILNATVTLEPGLAGEQWVRELIPGLNAIPMTVGVLADVVERENNDTPERAMPLRLPVTVNGRFFRASDEDWFTIQAEKDKALTITCRPSPRGTAALPIVELLNDAGEVLSEARSVESPDRECRIEWSAPADGTYRLRLHDLQRGIRGGREFIYRLSVQPAQPDFRLRLEADFANVVQGGNSELKIALERRGGFDQAVDLVFKGLPAGVAIEPTRIPKDKNQIKLVLRANEDARSTDATVRIIGRTIVGEKVIERLAVAPHLGIDAEGVSVGPPVFDHLHLTVQHKPVFRLFCKEAYQYAHRGTVHLYRMDIERLDGFDGEIRLQIGDRQNRDLDGVEMFETVIPPDRTTAMMPIHMPEAMHINEQSQSQLYVQGYTIFQDARGERQSLLVVSEKRCMIRTLPTVVKLEARDARVNVRPATTVPCHLRLKRTPNFAGAMEVRLLHPTTAAGFGATPVRIAAGKTDAIMTVHVDADATVPPDTALRFRAVGMRNNGTTVITEVAIPISFNATVPVASGL